MELHRSKSRQRKDRDAGRHGGGSGYDQDGIQKSTRKSIPGEDRDRDRDHGNREKNNSDKEKAKHLSKHFEEQDYNIVQGQSVVLTLKDHSILADDDINEELDMLESVEIEEQKHRNEAYKAAKKITDKFSDDPPASDKRCFEDLNSSGKTSSDYYTQQEMLKFNKPKKTKSIRKKENALDLDDALEVEAVSAGLGAQDLGSRTYGRRNAIREEQERSEAETRSNAYQTALAKAYEASKSLQPLDCNPVLDEDENPDDEEDLFKSVERARKLALQKETYGGPQAVARLAMAKTNNQDESINGESEEENKVVFTEMDEFVWGLQLSHKPDVEAGITRDQEKKDQVNDTCSDDNNSVKEDVFGDAITREVPVGKGLSGALELLKKRGSLNEGPEWGGRNMDMKKNKLLGYDDGNNERFKDIQIERRDEFGRIMTPKEAFRKDSHKFHGKGPGKGKQEKRRKQYLEERKLKQMNSSSVERIRETQAQLKTPYLVLSTGHV